MTAVVVSALLLGGWEVFWRLRGFTPTLSDDSGIWAIARSRASGLPPPGVALVGASRIQLGIDPEVFKEATGLRPVMLAIDGSSPLPVLGHLAEDPAFDSHVIVSLLPMFLAEPVSKDRAMKWIRHYEERNWSSGFETRLSMCIQLSLVFRSAALAPDKLWEQLREGSWPVPPYAPMRPDRYRPGLFSRIDIEKLRRSRKQREREIHAGAVPLSKEKFFERVGRLNLMLERIRSKGGDVAFVRFPSGGAVRRLEQKDWPREKYWDVFAARTDAVTIHYEDFPRLRNYRTPDGSHLDAADARRFVHDLVAVMEARGFAPWKRPAQKMQASLECFR